MHLFIQIGVILLSFFANNNNVVCLEYQKSKNIKNKPHFNLTEPYKNIHNVTSKEDINPFFKKPKNLIIIFINSWCINCPLILNSFQKASMYYFVQNTTNILLSNCMIHNSLCKEYNITSYPSIKVFLYTNNLFFEETNHIPLSFELEDILEYIDKISSSLKLKATIKLSSMKSFNNFNKNNGDVSYVLLLPSNNDNEEIKECYDKFALSKEYLPRFYFAYMDSSKFTNIYGMKFPSIVLTGINYKDFNINKYITNCNDIFEFINENQYPLFVKGTKTYLDKMHKLLKTVFIITIDTSSVSQVNQIVNMVQTIAINRRDLIFLYLDIYEDAELIKFFNIHNNINDIDKKVPNNIIVYNFKIGKHYIDKYDNDMKLQEIIKLLDEGKIKWKSGYYIEDLLNSLGFNIDRNILIIFIFIIITLVVISIMICLCNCIHIIDSKIKKD